MTHGIPRADRPTTCTTRIAPVSVLTDRSTGSAVALRRPVADHRERQHGEEYRERGEAAERDGPRRGVQQHRQRDQCHDLPELADDASQLHENRCALRGEPRCDHPQHAGEDGGVARPDENARQDADGHDIRERHDTLAERHEDHPDHDDRSRAEPVEQQPHGDLHRAVYRELDDGEHRQCRGIRIESHLCVDADRRQRCAIDDRDDIREETDRPDRPRAPARRIEADRSRQAGSCPSVMGRMPGPGIRSPG